MTSTTAAETAAAAMDSVHASVCGECDRIVRNGYGHQATCSQNRSAVRLPEAADERCPQHGGRSLAACDHPKRAETVTITIKGTPAEVPATAWVGWKDGKIAGWYESRPAGDSAISRRQIDAASPAADIARNQAVRRALTPAPAAKPGRAMKMADRLPLLVTWATEHAAGFTLAELAAANGISLTVAKYSWPDERTTALLAAAGLTATTTGATITLTSTR